MATVSTAEIIVRPSSSYLLPGWADLVRATNYNTAYRTFYDDVRGLGNNDGDVFYIAGAGSTTLPATDTFVSRMVQSGYRVHKLLTYINGSTVVSSDPLAQDFGHDADWQWQGHLSRLHWIVSDWLNDAEGRYGAPAKAVLLGQSYGGSHHLSYLAHADDNGTAKAWIKGALLNAPGHRLGTLKFNDLFRQVNAASMLLNSIPDNGKRVILTAAYGDQYLTDDTLRLYQLLLPAQTPVHVVSAGTPNDVSSPGSIHAWITYLADYPKVSTWLGQLLSGDPITPPSGDVVLPGKGV